MTHEKQKLQQLNAALKALHKDLLLIQCRTAEDVDERRYGPYDLLHLCLNDDRFEWLRKLSLLMTQIDHRIHDDEEVEVLDLESIYDEVWRLLHNEYRDFSEHYNLALNRDPHLYMKQGAVLGALEELQPLVKSMHEMHAENESWKMQNNPNL